MIPQHVANVMPDEVVRIPHNSASVLETPSHVLGTPTFLHDVLGTAQSFSLDWLSYHTPAGTSVDDALPFPIDPRHWGGRRGSNGNYPFWQEAVGGIRMGYHPVPGQPRAITLDGKACRFIEQQGIVPDWDSYIAWLAAGGHRVTRIDIAIDSDTVPVTTMRDAIAAGAYTSRVAPRIEQKGLGPV